MKIYKGSGLLNGDITVKAFNFEFGGYKFIMDVEARAKIRTDITVRFYKSTSYYEQDCSETDIDGTEVEEITELEGISEILVYSLKDPTTEIELTDEIEAIINTEKFDDALLSALRSSDAEFIVDEDSLDTSDISVDDYGPDYDDYEPDYDDYDD